MRSAEGLAQRLTNDEEQTTKLSPSASAEGGKSPHGSNLGGGCAILVKPRREMQEDQLGQAIGCNRHRNPVQRRAVSRRSIASWMALLLPTSTTSFLPRVIAV